MMTKVMHRWTDGDVDDDSLNTQDLKLTSQEKKAAKEAEKRNVQEMLASKLESVSDRVMSMDQRLHQTERAIDELTIMYESDFDSDDGMRKAEARKKFLHAGRTDEMTNASDSESHSVLI